MENRQPVAMRKSISRLAKHIFEWKSRGNHVFLMHSRSNAHRFDRGQLHSGLAELELKTGIGMEMGMENDCRHNLNEK